MRSAARSSRGLGAFWSSRCRLTMLKREAPRAKSEYVYRRTLDARELLPALGVAVGMGAVAFYVAYVLLQRTPLDPGTLPAAAPAKRLTRGAAD